MAPLGWQLVGLVWGYCLVLSLIQDLVKLAAYRIFDRRHAGFLVKEAKEFTYGSLAPAGIRSIPALSITEQWRLATFSTLRQATPNVAQ
jgi:hypothetical protein